MKLRIKVVIIGISILMFLCLVKLLPALTVEKLKDLSIVNYHFTTRISNGRRIIYTKNPSSGRYVVMKLAATLEKNEGKIFTNDFVLKYFHSNGKEDRSQCEAIAIAETPELGDFSSFAIGSNGAWAKMNKGKIYFGVVFFIEPDVELVELYPIGRKPLTYRIGSDRLCSIHISTNRDSNLLLKAEKVIREGGYHIVGLSKKLAKDITGTTIHYADKTEAQAREISQRIMTELGIVPTLKKMRLITEVDIVVWFGKK